MSELKDCKNCDHQIIKQNGVWKHYYAPNYDCPTGNRKGKCGYTRRECAEKWSSPCSDMFKITKRCGCGCNYPKPYSRIQRIVKIVF